MIARRALLGLGGCLAVVLLWSATLTVDETELVVVTEFGKVVAVYGAEPRSSGLHFKKPWQGTMRLDRRTRLYDPPAREVITGDKRSLEVIPYVAYRIADPIQFIRGSGSHAVAEARLGERLSSTLSDAIGRRELSAILTTDPEKSSLQDLTESVAEAIRPAAQTELGIEVIDVGLRRLNHPLEVRPAIFDLIRSERRKAAAALRAEGEAEYTRFTSQARREADAILAQAEADAQRVRGQAEAESIRILNDAHRRDVKFFEFLRTLESYTAILDSKTTIVLPSSSPLLRLLHHGPSGDLAAEPEPRTAAETTQLPKPREPQP